MVFINKNIYPVTLFLIICKRLNIFRSVHINYIYSPSYVEYNTNVDWDDRFLPDIIYDFYYVLVSRYQRLSFR